jgi:DDE superfamily endonuclease
MPILPSDIMPVLSPFAQVFSDRIWQWVQVLVVGAVLAPGRRTVSAVLRVMGLSQERQFQNYHRVLNRVKWSGLALSRILLGLLVTAFVAAGLPLVIAADETLERRTGPKIYALGSFRDPVRSTKKRKVMSFGLRWISMMLLVRVPWSARVWALPFLTVLAPGPKPHGRTNRRHKTSVDWIGQMILAVRRWQPHRPLVLVVDGALAAVKLALRCQRAAVPITFVSRLRPDACLYDPTPRPRTGKRGCPPKYGMRLPTMHQRLTDPTTVWETVPVPWYGGTIRPMALATGVAVWRVPKQAPLTLRWVLIRDPQGELAPHFLFGTDVDTTAVQIVTWFVMRWSEEVTFEEVRAHLGVETQRQWSKLAIERTTPVLLGLFSVVTLLAEQLRAGQPHPVRTAAWYVKNEATFADTIAVVRRHLWSTVKFPQSPGTTGQVTLSAAVVEGLIDSLCYAA